MKTLRALFLWLLILVVLGAVSWAITLYMQWPLWTIAALVLGALGVYFLVRFSIRLVQVYQSRTRMAKLSGTEQKRVARALTPRAALIRKWTAATNLIRKSSLKRFGNPLYVLPWFMVIGKSGTGKTTALTRTRLASSLQKVSQVAPVEQTANYDWWFFDRAVVIDCAGRYVEAADLDQDRSEWELGLDLLAKYRGKEGLNGLVLAISTERLVHPEKDSLMDEGRVIRGRIDQLIRLFGKRFPIYVLVTQCDRIYGLEQWVGMLPENSLEQAMGYLATTTTSGPDEPKFLDKAFDCIEDRLQGLRLELINRKTGKVEPSLLLFPNELSQLKPGLEVFLRSALGDNAYLETPFLRGLFFSSGQQEGGAVSTLLGNVLPPAERHASTNAGLFLHDLFGRILPQDRYISLRASLRNPWRSATQNLGLLSWLLLSAAVAIFMTYGFLENTETMRLLAERSRDTPKFVGRLDEDTSTLEKIGETIALIESRNDNWKTQWMVESTNIDDLEAKLKGSFTDNFRKYIVPLTDADYNSDIQRVMQAEPGTEYAEMARNAVRYINILKARERGAELAALKAMPQRQDVVRYTPAMYTQMNALYAANVAWSLPGDSYVPSRLRFERQVLDRMVFRDPTMKWLTFLPGSDPTSKPVTVAEFWRGTSNDMATRTAATTEPQVPAAFTRAGKRNIDQFLVEMEKSIEDGPKFLTQRAAFETWYKAQRFQVWQKFAAAFPGTERTLAGEAEWQAALGVVASAKSPYYLVMDRLDDEFSDLPVAQLPGWLQLSRELGKLRAQASRMSSVGSTLKVVDAINTVGNKAINEVLSGTPATGEATVKDNLAAAAAIQNYQKNLAGIAAEVATGPGKAWQLAADFHGFSNDPAVKTSSLQTAAAQMVGLRKLVGFQGPEEEAVWQLMAGSLRFLLLYTEEQASCSLQKEWESKVDWPLQTAPNMAAMIDQLYGAKGSIWAFVDGPAKPFIQRDSNRFGIVQTLGYSVPFTSEFLPMLNDAAGRRVEHLVMQQQTELEDQTQKLQGEKEQLQTQQALAQVDRAIADNKQKAEVLKAQVLQLGITGQPTSINPGAKAKPFLTVLTIQCAAGARVINNYNFPASDSFPLGERSCGEVTLQIKIDDLVLTKKYPGTQGMIRFLQDFRDGSRQFNVDEFPAAKARLEALGVRQFGVHYSFDGQAAILKNAQQLELLDKLEKDKTAEKQRLQDGQFAQAQKGIQTKIANVNRTPSTEISVTKQIGVCWNARLTAHRAQDTEAMFKSLAAAQMAAPMSTGVAAGPARKPAGGRTGK